MKALKFLKPIYILFVSLIVGLVYIQVSADLKLADFLGQIVKLIMTPGTAKADLVNIGIDMLTMCLLSVLCVILVSLISSRIGAGYSKNLRSKLFSKVQDFSMNEINQFSTSSLITRTTNDITQIQNSVIMFLRLAITGPIMAFKAIGEILDKSNELSLVTAIAIFVLAILIVSIFVFAVPRFQKLQNKTDKLNSVTRENLTGIRVIRAFNAEQLQQQKVDNANSDLTKTNLQINNAMMLLFPGMTVVMMSLNLSITWVGSYLVDNFLQVGQFIQGAQMYSIVVSFSQYAMQIVMSFMMMTMLFVFLPRGIVSLNRVSKVLFTPISIKDKQQNNDQSITTLQKDNINENKDNTTDNQQISNDNNSQITNENTTDTTTNELTLSNNTNSQQTIGKLEFKNVSFKYPGAEEYVLKDISFKIEKGQKLAIIGSTGSGKSTLLNLIPRFYDVSQGSILINDIDIKDYSLETLHKLLGYIPQKGFLFGRTIKENMLFAKPDATDEQIENACKIAQAHDFIQNLDGKYDYHISQGGKNVSGGQRQRLSIARAVLTNSQFFLFDDTFSALDYKTDKVLRKALSDNLQDSTNIVVAQRIGTIMDSDAIVVLDQGEMVGLGTHKQLMKKCPVYKQIALSQLSKEELENGTK